ncbi:MAG TPA: hypothetical protein DIC51_03910 [Coxiellaceae bacterium]|nr:hypothetical protein [Coxiellaceae bacterium]
MEIFSHELHAITLMLMVINAVIHILFAGAVAKDAGRITKNGADTHLVSPMTWSIATLLGGVIVAAIYWFMHHLNYAKR